jgi:xylulokinase
VILTLDLGTSVTKVGLWDHNGLVALAGVPVATAHPAPGWAEQQPTEWWTSLTAACSELSARVPGGFGSVEVVGCTGARQTFALVDTMARPLGPAIVWSDQRAVVEAQQLRQAQGATVAGLRAVADAGSMAAKIAWLAAHDRGRLDAGAWLLAPRDLVAWWLTGTVATDVTMASRTGLYDNTGRVDAVLAGPAAAKLAPVFASDQVTGGVAGPVAEVLGLAAGTPVVIGAGDRASEVLGAGADEQCPMVSWGTTANVSLPLTAPPDELGGAGVVLSAGALGGWLLEAGLSAAGSMMAWLSQLTGRPPEELVTVAAASPPGARGVTATPWLGGARAPWWRHDARAALVGLEPSHGPGDVARAVFEAVAWDLQRSLEVMAARRPAGPPPAALVLGGSGAAQPVWHEVLGGITGLPLLGRRSGQAASAGAALLAARAVGIPFPLDTVDPVDRRSVPDGETVRAYLGCRPAADRTASAVMGLAGPVPGGAWT